MRGKFQDLSMRLGIGFKVQSSNTLCELFTFSEEVDMNLNLLQDKNGRQGTNACSKEAKHIISLFNLAYNLAMDPNKDMSPTLACKWDLELD